MLQDISPGMSAEISCHEQATAPGRMVAGRSGSGGAVQPVAQFLAGLEERHPLFFHMDRFAGARVATAAGRAVLDGESAKAAQFHAVALGQCIGDLFKHRADDVFNIALEKMRIAAGDDLNEFRFDHGFNPLLLVGSAAFASGVSLFRRFSTRHGINVPNRKKSVKEDALFRDILDQHIGFLRQAEELCCGMDDQVAQ